MQLQYPPELPPMQSDAQPELGNLGDPVGPRSFCPQAQLPAPSQVYAYTTDSLMNIPSPSEQMKAATNATLFLVRFNITTQSHAPPFVKGRRDVGM